MASEYFGDQILQAVRLARQQVVHVRTLESDNRTVTMGSGVLVDHSHVITNAQIVSGDEKRITIRTENGRKYDAEVVGVDPLYFISLLEIDGWISFEPLPLLTVDEAEVGMPVVAVGNALGHDYSASFGIIGGKDRTVYRPERLPVDGLIFTDARIHPGNTAGGLVTLDGRLAGFNGIPWQHGTSLAVHADVAWRIAHQILDYGAATHAWLGFSGEPEIVDQAVVELFSLPFDRGVTVMRVASGGPGEQAGVQVGDMIVRVRDQDVTGLGSIRRILSLHRTGEKLPLTVLRSGELKEVCITVREMPRLQEQSDS